MGRSHFASLLALAVGLAGPAGSQPPEVEESPPLTRCTDPRPQMCTRQYDPVCGQRSAGEPKTYGNACTACSDASVVGHRPGACE